MKDDVLSAKICPVWENPGQNSWLWQRKPWAPERVDLLPRALEMTNFPPWAASPFQGFSKMGSRTDRDRTTNSRPKKTEATDCSRFESRDPTTTRQRPQSRTVDSSQYFCDKRPQHQPAEPLTWVHNIEIILRQPVMTFSGSNPCQFKDDQK